MCPRVLRVETGFSKFKHIKHGWWTDILDYQIYNNVPSWWRRLEIRLRLDIFLALSARKLVNNYDLVWADSEKVGILLTNIKKPLVVLSHHLASRRKRYLLRLSGIVKSWSGIGYLSDADRNFIMSYYAITPDRLFRAITPDLSRFSSTSTSIDDGPIVSLGVSKRDYGTLVEALKELPGYSTEVYVGSKFGDLCNGKIQKTIPEWIQFKPPAPSEEVIDLYRRARFVVLPLVETTQFSAGMNVAMEASASGKAVIATNIPGMSTYIVDGVTGILVPPYDSSALRAAIGKLWGQSGLAARMGLAGRKYVLDRFDPEKENSNIKDFLLMLHTKAQLD